MTTIHAVLEEFAQAATDNRDKGDKFERLIATYLVTDPQYQEQYDAVWLWNEWPDRGKQPDTGIDLVARERLTGDFCAIQCKFYDPKHTLQKHDIDSFFTASGKSFPTLNGEKSFTSRILVSTTDKWSKHADEALNNQQIPVFRLRVQDLADSPVDWSTFTLNRPQDITLKKKKDLRPHQKEALVHVEEGFKTADRGKLIMACGTGKTFTSLKMVEAMVPADGCVLFLVPSISLLSQTLREWTAETAIPMRSFAVCSDSKVGKAGENEDIRAHDLAFPATTDTRKLAHQIKALNAQSEKKLTVIFSTYQSIEVVAEAQKNGVPDFDLIICDEAHRTTGVIIEGEEESHFVRVHDQKFIKGKKRLYMTATPRIFGDAVKSKADESDAVLCSMDDEGLYGPEFHRLGFSEAITRKLLTDYKVMVLAVDEKHVSTLLQSQIADSNNEINLDDAVKIVGCWNGLSKRMARSVDGDDLAGDTKPMRRAVAFSRSIKDSKKLTAMFSEVIADYSKELSDNDDVLTCEVDHVDGSFNALKRNDRLDWLKADTSDLGNHCRILSNARCLSEGVDVPSLDAVMFLNPRNSVVDVVQSVGRVMRKVEGKDYGYIILPIGVPADMTPEDALKDNQKYKVVWQVLQALRAHDDRFNATVNQLELNKARPEQIQVIGVGGGSSDSENGSGEGAGGKQGGSKAQFAFDFPNLAEWRDAIFARIVKKCGDRRYWETWAKDVAQIAERHITRIKALLDDPNPVHRQAFDAFLEGLRENLNPGISKDDAIEMLSQHLITKPVFDALFDGYSFAEHNPVSISMQKMLDVLEGQALEKETHKLDKFYASVQERAAGIDNVEGKQKIIIELYNKFFIAAFPRMAERLGIVYTPTEVVDFIIHSADDALHQEFGVGLSDPGVHVLDPFSGTGTFLVRLLQSGLIPPKDLLHKYKNELHCNEIVLLAYYIAAINIEETFHDLTGGAYEPFPGIVLTDTFQMTEKGDLIDKVIFPENNDRAALQNQSDIRVIMGNPPYSAGQDSANDGNQNLNYPCLDEAIRGSYAAKSSAGLKRNLYDSYIRAIRWASDRIKDKGIICYVSNGSFIDANNMDGLRKCLTDEFTSIHCFNLRGNQRTSGELSRMEGGKIFGSDSRTPVAITLMIKNPEKTGPCQLFYKDIGDYLDRAEKLAIVAKARSISGITWNRLIPNIDGDWINLRDPAFDLFIPLGDKTDKSAAVMFDTYSLGVSTNRDAWVYNFSRNGLSSNMSKMIDFYNEQVTEYKKQCAKKTKDQFPALEKFIDTDPKKISWTVNLKADLARNTAHQFDSQFLTISMYRPFCKQWLYFNRRFNERVLLMPKLFPLDKLNNLVISVTGIGASKGFSALMTNTVANLHLHDTGQCFPLYHYEKVDATAGDLFSGKSENGYVKKDAINDATLTAYRTGYSDPSITKEDIFYYVYGILHSPEYKTRFASDLKKMVPRIPFAQDFKAFSQAGRALATWHLNYESVEPYPVQETAGRLGLSPKDDYRVTKMAFGKNAGKPDKSIIVFNSHITLSGIPLETYDYVVNGKPALEWIMERYAVTKEKDSGIINDANDWSDDPMYIINLVKRIIRVSIETAEIVKSLPALLETK